MVFLPPNSPLGKKMAAFVSTPASELQSAIMNFLLSLPPEQRNSILLESNSLDESKKKISSLIRPILSDEFTQNLLKDLTDKAPANFQIQNPVPAASAAAAKKVDCFLFPLIESSESDISDDDESEVDSKKQSSNRFSNSSKNNNSNPISPHSTSAPISIPKLTPKYKPSVKK